MTSIRDGSNARVRPTARSHQDRTAPPTGGGAPTSGARLLLAPKDANAGRALEKVLHSAGIDFDRIGPLFALHRAGRDDTAAHELLKTRIPDLLQSRISGVFADEVGPTEKLVDALIQAEPLTTLFDCMDVEWARVVLAEDRLFSVYHPIVHSTDGSIFAYEALLRATMPGTGEVVGAGRLLYACDRLNLRHALDQQARVAAIRGAADLDLSTARLFVNFLPNTIYDPEICLRATVEAAAAHGIPLSRLVFEVADMEQTRSAEQLRGIVEYCRQCGAALALDDISSGFASLQYLADVVPDYAKIDRLLVESAVASTSARQTLDSIVQLAAKLGVTVIAEGIETTEQMRVCVDAGVGLLQGFLFAHPATPPQAVAQTAFGEPPLARAA